MTKKELSYQVEKLQVDLDNALKIKNDLFQDFTKQVLERDNLINGLRNTIFELTEERQVFNAYQEQFLIHLKAKDDKISELSKVIRGLESDLSALKAQKDPEELTKEVWRRKEEVKQLEASVSELEARVEKYSNIHKGFWFSREPYYMCAIEEMKRDHDEDLFNLTGR